VPSKQGETMNEATDLSLAFAFAKMNQQLTQAEREAFNEWRAELFRGADQVRDWVRRTSHLTDVEAPSVDAVINLICKAPRLEK
jgi:hypothetical protein